jgi:hypothetical protein
MEAQSIQEAKDRRLRHILHWYFVSSPTSPSEVLAKLHRPVRANSSNPELAPAQLYAYKEHIP